MLERVFGTRTGRSLWHDLRVGTAGVLPRVALSVVAALLLLTGVFACLGIVEETSSGYISDDDVALALGIASLVWFGLLLAIWWRYPRFGEWIRLGLTIIGIWIAAICAIALIVSIVRREEFFIAAIIVFAIGLTIGVVLLTVYQWSLGKRVITPDGQVDVVCPMCGYSLIGLRDLTCPECGATFTVDELIRSQDYDSVRSDANVVTRALSKGMSSLTPSSQPESSS